MNRVNNSKIKFVLITYIVFMIISIVIVISLIVITRKKTVTNDITKVELTEKFKQFKIAKEKLLNEPITNGPTVSFIAVGDISYSRGVGRMVKYKNDINFPFVKTKDILSSADITYANLETPITEGPEIPNGSYVFRSDPGTVIALKSAGIDIVNLANNHSMNFDTKGLTDTLRYLDNVDIKYVGAGNNSTESNAPLIVEKNGITFAILSYEEMDIVPASYEATSNKPGIAFMRIEQMQNAVKSAKDIADIVIVAMHAGEEYIPEGNDLQKTFAHAAVDSGAEIVIGDHPHVIQNAETYKGKMIFYSLGNFIMDQMWSEETRQAIILKAIFNKNGLVSFTTIPVQIEDYSQPNLVWGELANKINSKLKLPKSINIDTNNDITVGNNSTMPLPINNKIINKDIDGDGNIETLLLTNGILTIKSNNKTTYISPKNWWIDDFSIDDSINSGKLALNMSVWKEGNYGDSKPFWVTENDDSIRNHFFVFSYKNNKLTPIWQSSNLSVPNCSFMFKDVNNDKENELLTYEGNYSDFPNCIPEYTAVWKWKEWGFYNQSRSEKTNYR